MKRMTIGTNTWLALRALAVMTVMMLTTTTVWATIRGGDVTANPTLTLAGNADNSASISEASGSTYDVTLDGHTFYRDGSWNTLCLPFNLSSLVNTPLEGATVKTLGSSSYSNGTLTVNFTNASTIEAGKPYAVKWGVDFIIRSAADWDTFVDNVKNGNTYAGKVVKLAADIAVSKMVGTGTLNVSSGTASYTNPFCGTFDGCGHTLTFTIDIASTGENGAAPFRFVNGATIQNLIIAGSNTSARRENAGLIAYSFGAVTISNCVVNATITNNVGSTNFSYGDSACGGFIANIQSGNVTMNNCLFSGKMLGSANHMGGFVGWRNGTPRLVLNNCLFNPAELKSNTTQTYTFFRGGEENPSTYSFTNTYYKKQFGSAQGTYTNKTGNELASQLGNGWEVNSGNVLPKMKNTISNITNPVFTGVTISDAANNVTTTNAKFIGSYKPFSDNSLLLDTHNSNGDAMHAALDITPTPDAPTAGYGLEGWYTDANKSVAATTIPFTDNGNTTSVTLYARFTPILFAAGTTNEWMTWCGDEVYKVPTGCAAYEVTGIDGGSVALSPLTTIPAYTPVLINRSAVTLTNDIVAPFKSVATAPTSWYDNQQGLVATTATGCTLIGNATGTAMGTGNIAAGRSYGLYNGEFLIIDTDNGIPAHRCILTLDAAGARQLNIVIGDGEATGVEPVADGRWSKVEAQWFDLKGRKFSGKPSRAGIYINNSVKVVVK